MSAHAEVRNEDTNEVADVNTLSDDEYAELKKQIETIEVDFKKGEVDKNEEEAQGPSFELQSFERRLDRINESVKQNKDLLLAHDPELYYRFRAMHAECIEYFSSLPMPDLSDLYNEAKQLFSELRLDIEMPLTEKKRELIENKIRLIVEGLEYLYKEGNFEKGIDRANELYKIVEGLEASGHYVYWAKAKVNYFQGRLYRQRGKEHDFEKATAKFYESSENYFKCVKKNSTEADVIYSRTRASVCLGFGIGFLNYTRSFLQRAKNVITPARLSFYKNDGKPCCQIHFYYLNLLYASVLRAEAGQASTEEKRAKLFEAQDILEVCEQVFYRKPKYLVHAHYNLALLFYSLGKEKYGKALEHIDKIIDLSQGNPKWEANALIVKSRIYRQEGHHDEALQAASKACRQSVDYRAIYCEALLARGQAHLERKNFSAAQDDFNDVIDRNNNENQKVEAVALIYLTRTALNQNKRDDALELFGRVRGMMNTIEHGFVIDEFEKLKEELKVGPAPFFVSYREEDLTWDKHEKNLKKWLLQRALSTDKNVANAAKQLGVSNKTVYQWIKEFKESKSADT